MQNILPVLHSKACASLASKDASVSQLTGLVALTSLEVVSMLAGLVLASWLALCVSKSTTFIFSFKFFIDLAPLNLLSKRLMHFAF